MATSIDAKGPWLNERLRRLLLELRDTVLEGGGLILLTGAPGAGKTTMANAFVTELAGRALVARVFHPEVDLVELGRVLTRDLGVDVGDATPAALVDGVSEIVHRAHREGERVLILIDEAQHLAPEVGAVLAEMLDAAPPAGGRKPSILLVGEEEALTAVLAERHPVLLEHLARTVRIPPLLEDEAHDFIRHRFAAAGLDPDALTGDALRAVVGMSDGTPRVIANVCDAVLVEPLPRDRRIAGRLIEELAQRFGVVPDPGPVAPAHGDASPAGVRTADVAGEAWRGARRGRRLQRRSELRTRRLRLALIVVVVVGVAATVTVGLVPAIRRSIPASTRVIPVGGPAASTPAHATEPLPTLPVVSDPASEASFPRPVPASPAVSDSAVPAAATTTSEPPPRAQAESAAPSASAPAESPALPRPATETPPRRQDVARPRETRDAPRSPERRPASAEPARDTDAIIAPIRPAPPERSDGPRAEPDPGAAIDWVLRERGGR